MDILIPAITCCSTDRNCAANLLASKWITESNHWLAYGTWQPQFNAFMVERYTDQNVYWLSVGTAPGLRMPTRAGTPSGSAVRPDYYTATARAEGVSLLAHQYFYGRGSVLLGARRVGLRPSPRAPIPLR